MRVLTQVIVIAALATAGGGGWYYQDRLPWGDSAKAARQSPRPDRTVLVDVAQARRGAVTVSVEAVGTAHAIEAIIVTSKVTGIISKIHFEEGQRVSAGTVLVELDSRELQAELAEMRAEHDNALRLYDRVRKLYETRNVPLARLDELYGELMAAEARVSADEARLSDYVIRAPFDGRLGLRRVSVGALVNPGAEITTLDDTSRIKVDLRVPETALARVAAGQPLTVRSAAYPGRVFEGRVMTIGSRVDPVTRSVEVRGEFANDDDALRPGMFLTSTLTTATRADAVLIPEEAVVSSGDTQFLFAVIDGKAVKREIDVGEHIAGEVEVLSGLDAGVAVIVGGVQKVRDGTKVKAVPVKRANAPAAGPEG